MVMLKVCATIAALSVVADSVTPVQKVTQLLEGLKKNVEAEGKKESASYSKFACFCKDTTQKKSTSITETQDKIDTTTADIGKMVAVKNGKITKHGKEQQKVESTTTALKKSAEEHVSDMRTYQRNNVELTKAITSVKKALSSLKVAKGLALLSLGDQSGVREVLDMAQALDMIHPDKQPAVTALLQQGVDPNDPAYKFHSSKIIEIIESLGKDFKTKKEKAHKEWEKTLKSYKEEKKTMEGKISTAVAEIKTLSGEIDKLKASIAKNKESLVSAEASLKDDSTYLRDLTMRCQQKGQDWDQRSSTRNAEVKALAQALKILGSRVKKADKVNKRALLLAKPAPAKVAAAPAKVVVESAEQSEAAAEAAEAAAAVTGKAKSFLQLSSAKGQERRAIELLHHEGLRLNSAMLSSLVSQMRADPFGKVKNLIQGLVERLLEESKGEATKKGFCDEELGKSYTARDARHTQTQKLSAELSTLRAAETAVTDEIAELISDVAGLQKDLKQATSLRKEEKTENAETVQTATEGGKAVGEALAVLKKFFTSAAKASALVQVSAVRYHPDLLDELSTSLSASPVQMLSSETNASPVDEDSPGAGFDGAYKGSQDSSKAILGLLQTIQTDFERTLRKTRAEESQASKEFVAFERSSKADIKGKQMKTMLDKQDLASTKSDIASDLKDMKTAQKLLDSALKNIEELKPTCLDTGMSYKERVQKREEEIESLGKALKMLK